MTIRTKSYLEFNYLTPTGIWPDNIVGDITPAKLRGGIQDTLDTVYNDSMQTSTSGKYLFIDSTGMAFTPGMTGIAFSPTTSFPSWREGLMFYDNVNKTHAIYNDHSDVTLQIGQEMHVRCVNRTGSIIPDGTVVQLDGAQGNRPKVKPSLATKGLVDVLGFATHDIGINEEGLITTEGTITYDTRPFNEGDNVYLSPITSGQITNITPSGSAPSIICGHVLNSTVQGKILVHVEAAHSLTDLRDVDGTIPISGSLLVYNKSGEYWDPSNKITVDSNDTIVHGSGWRDLLSPMSVAQGGAHAPTWGTWSGNFYAMLFDAGPTDDEVMCQFHLGHDYCSGTNIYPHVHWCPTTTNTGVVVWGFEYTIAKGHQQQRFTTATTVYMSGIIPAGSGQTNKHYITEVPDTFSIPSTNLEPDSLVIARVFRQSSSATDTYPDNVAGLYVDLHYLSDREVTKNKAPNFYQ